MEYFFFFFFFFLTEKWGVTSNTDRKTEEMRTVFKWVRDRIAIYLMYNDLSCLSQLSEVGHQATQTYPISSLLSPCLLLLFSS